MDKKVLKQLYKEFGTPKQDKESMSSISNIFYDMTTNKKG